MTVPNQAAQPAELSPPAPLGPYVPCSDCKQAIRTYYFSLNGERPVCTSCKKPYANSIALGTGPDAFARVLVHGAAAAAGLAVVLGGLIMAIGFLRIFAAIAVGYLIGRVIQKTNGGFYDRRYQIIAAVLTWLTIGVATLLPVIVEAVRYEPPPAAAPAPAAETRDEDVASPDVASADSENPWAETDSLVAEIDANNGRLPVPQEKTPAQQLAEGNAVSRVANTLLLIALLPVLGLLAYGVHAAGIGILALGFGIYKAWDITGQGVAHELSGPHRVGTGPIPQAR